MRCHYGVSIISTNFQFIIEGVGSNCLICIFLPPAKQGTPSVDIKHKRVSESRTHRGGFIIYSVVSSSYHSLQNFQPCLMCQYHNPIHRSACKSNACHTLLEEENDTIPISFLSFFFFPFLFPPEPHTKLAQNNHITNTQNSLDGSRQTARQTTVRQLPIRPRSVTVTTNT